MPRPQCAGAQNAKGPFVQLAWERSSAAITG
jgi:hypothetical protein